MIKDIPSSEDFESGAKAQFDFAWDIAIQFLLTLDDATRMIGVEEEDEKLYWENAHQRILTSLIIAQQGIELALKGKLVAVSPYLLISGNHSDWPRDKLGSGVSFSEFRSIEAQDLVRVHNTVTTKELDKKFVDLFDRVRKLRNKAMHTVDRNLSVSAEEVIVILLEVHLHLFPDSNWVSTRRDFLYNSPAAHVLFSTDHIEGLVAREFWTVFNMLKPAQVKQFFKIDKKQRLYLCPECKYECDKFELIEPRYAVLQPNTFDSEGLYCFVCDKTHHVERNECVIETCPGNVFSTEYVTCCTCGES